MTDENANWMPPPSPGAAAAGADSLGAAAEGVDGETWFREIVSDTLGGRLALLRPTDAADTPTRRDTVSRG